MADECVLSDPSRWVLIFPITSLDFHLLIKNSWTLIELERERETYKGSEAFSLGHVYYRWDIPAPDIASIKKLDVNWSSMRVLPGLCGSLVFEHIQISWGSSSWTNLSCAWSTCKLKHSHYCLSFPRQVVLCFSLVLICKWSYDNWTYRNLKKKPKHIFLRTILVSQAVLQQSTGTVSNLLSCWSWFFLFFFLFQGAGQVSALPSISITLSADM